MRSVLLRALIGGLALGGAGFLAGLVSLSQNGRCVGPACTGLGAIPVVFAIMGAPWLLMFAAGLGTRAALALPIEQRASWIFRMTESEATRGQQLRAVVRLMRQATVGLPLVLMAPLEFDDTLPSAIDSLRLLSG